jgi:CheY-like chemotaxis protein
VDPERLHQLIWNLLSHAIKSTDRGGCVGLAISLLGGRLQIQVQDTGEGIDSALLPSVFHWFSPGEKMPARRAGRLGLAMMKHLVHLQGGTIEAQSPGVGKGSTFAVTLPVEGAPSDRVPPNQASGFSEARPSLAGSTVLVVDDETDTRNMVEATLEGSCARVITAADGVEALHRLQATEVDLVVSDLRMPEKDGFDLIRLIRLEEGAHQRLPVLALTARAREEDRRRALAAGFDAHLAKPVDPQKLVRLVAWLLRPGEGASEAVKAMQ